MEMFKAERREIKKHEWNYWSSVYTGHPVSIDGYVSAKVREFRSLGYIRQSRFLEVDGARKP
jgi:hypothetical protein